MDFWYTTIFKVLAAVAVYGLIREVYRYLGPRMQRRRARRRERFRREPDETGVMFPVDDTQRDQETHRPTRRDD